jgi:cardiolipin synthase
MKRFSLIFKVVLFVSFAVVLIANIYPPAQRIDHQLTVDYSVDDSQFPRALEYLLGSPFLEGNQIEPLYNGVQIFPAMLKAIASAQKTITFEAYIYWSDHIGQKFIEALTERARAGVKVHVLVDWLGSRKMRDEDVEKMKSAGVEIEIYRPPSWSNLTRMNNRTHRRILIIDGNLAFTGGVGINDDWDGNADLPTRWRDSQFRLRGPVVSYLQGTFMENWLKISPEVHHSRNYFPPQEKVGSVVAQVFKSSPQAGSENVRLMYLLAIASARKNILLESAYFVPDETTIEELIKARQRGVRIQVIVPGPFIDAELAKNASQALWGEMLKEDIEIYRYQPSRFHCKVMIVDEYFVSLGSTNFDDRSFRLNDEANVNILDTTFAKSQMETFENDKSKSLKMTLQEWENRSWFQKLKEKISLSLKTQI